MLACENKRASPGGRGNELCVAAHVGEGAGLPQRQRQKVTQNQGDTAIAGSSLKKRPCDSFFLVTELAERG